MRVTKTVKEYIAKEVKIRLKPKYQAEIDEWKAMQKKRDEFIDNILAASRNATVAYIEQHKGEVADFLDVKYKENQIDPGLRWNAFPYIDKEQVAHCSYAENRLNNETAEKVAKIIVELELGGNKADLMRLLNEI